VGVVVRGLDSVSAFFHAAPTTIAGSRAIEENPRAARALLGARGRRCVHLELRQGPQARPVHPPTESIGTSSERRRQARPGANLAEAVIGAFRVP
jgi:hypothetical protein